MNADTFIHNSRPFMEWMLSWKANLQPAAFDTLTHDGDPKTVGIISVDVIEGFCTIGPLSSPRVNGIVEPIAALFKLAWARGDQVEARARLGAARDAFAREGRRLDADRVDGRLATVLRS